MYLETERLIIRDWQPLHDARHALDIYGDQRVTRWLSTEEIDTSIHAVQGRLQRYVSRSPRRQTMLGETRAGKPLETYPGTLADTATDTGAQTAAATIVGTGIWAVVEKSIDHIIGCLLLIPLPDVDGQQTMDIEIGWHFRPASWGYGYATEAAQQIVDYARQQTELAQLFAVTLPENRRSIAVIERLGMESLGVTEQYYGGRSLLLYRLSLK